MDTILSFQISGPRQLNVISTWMLLIYYRNSHPLLKKLKKPLFFFSLLVKSDIKSQKPLKFPLFLEFFLESRRNARTLITRCLPDLNEKLKLVLLFSNAFSNLGCARIFLRTFFDFVVNHHTFFMLLRFFMLFGTSYKIFQVKKPNNEFVIVRNIPRYWAIPAIDFINVCDAS